jgi:hypothetical protein
MYVVLREVTRHAVAVMTVVLLVMLTPVHSLLEKQQQTLDPPAVLVQVVALQEYTGQLHMTFLDKETVLIRLAQVISNNNN